TSFLAGNFILNNGPIRFSVQLTKSIVIGGTVAQPTNATLTVSNGTASYAGAFTIPVFNGSTGNINISNSSLDIDPQSGKLKLGSLQVNVPSVTLGTPKSKADPTKLFTFKGLQFTYSNRDDVDPNTGKTITREVASGTATIVLKNGMELGCTVEVV